jgi:hypothetical protein
LPPFFTRLAIGPSSLVGATSSTSVSLNSKKAWLKPAVGQLAGAPDGLPEDRLVLSDRRVEILDRDHDVIDTFKHGNPRSRRPCLASLLN